MTNFDLIKEFRLALGQDNPEGPTIPAGRAQRLVHTLVREEMRELEAELGFLDLYQVRAEAAADPAAALAPLVGEAVDVLVVVYGLLAAYGVDADKVFAAVNAANMQKASGPVREDGKRMKPAGWQPADVVGLLREMTDAVR